MQHFSCCFYRFWGPIEGNEKNEKVHKLPGAQVTPQTTGAVPYLLFMSADAQLRISFRFFREENAFIQGNLLTFPDGHLQMA